ncbi:MAG TPA: ATP-dependent protease LonB [Bacillota bacterium]|nr:ATP-dependent protease LonB [Bacillota bacterium]HOB86383.1 ATP-dependent protease LonB [Bacillota bacterium]HOP69388.1 ATP-dependent protease LonB [Bacillota bacterium]HPT33205.1 ATP-dependent protease LonB [Bacillota bacterium]HPZ64396.1 ATP-dependent protease LonB [Bacillota bacterium]
MNNFAGILGLVQVFFAVVIGLYFFNLLRNQQTSRIAVDRESRKEMEQLERLRQISLTEPLSEKTRPTSFDEIIGQEDGLKALRAALCGPNPQHVLLYGPPGVGKTAAARLVLEEAKKIPGSPFGQNAKFVELDATTARFDERGIADPLIGTVHDPIYQGAGPLGMAGIPQPKPGAVTKAHGGILFIDEIGELHPIQINKLLKVLEDRKVFMESSYYNSEDQNIPRHIHEIFQKGLPADFRLIGATTRMPHELPPAIRSRCLEIFFRGLRPAEIGVVAANAVRRINFQITEEALEVVKRYAVNGREAVNMIQLAAGIAQNEKRRTLTREDIEWVVNSTQHNPRPEIKPPAKPQVGYVNGLAVYGPNMGTLIEVEATTMPVRPGQGKVSITGIIEEEEMGRVGHTIRRRGAAKDAAENVITVLSHLMRINLKDYDIHLNFPGGIPVDGPSAGVAMATAIYSSLTNSPVDSLAAMTGELSVRGLIRPVGGVVAKINAAVEAGIKKILLPEENYQKSYAHHYPVQFVPVRHLEQVFREVIIKDRKAAVGSP